MTAAQLSLLRAPQTRTELYLLTQVLWNITIPSKRVCPDHSSPFDAYAEAYFAETPVSVWLASRGLGGKSRTLAYLTLTEATTLGADATLLGGSFAQSQNVQEAMKDGWDAPLAPRQMVVSDTATKLVLSNDATVRPLTASQKQARGPHPQRLRMDEADEMDLPIFDAAMGQALADKGIQSHTAISSTHQYPDGTFTEVLKRAAERDWPVHRWCWKESSNDYDGWLTPEMIERKRSEVSAEMWRVEFDLQEPSVGNRAFDTEAVERMFTLASEQEYDRTVRTDLERYEFEKPVRGAEYVIAADWAKEQDYTVICVFRTERRPMKLVWYYRARRRPYPVMIKEFNDQLKRYYARGIHDATGVGNAINDLLDFRAQKFLMVGRERDDLLSEYVSAVERDLVRAPRIPSAYSAHKYCTVEDLYLHREYYSSHLPDEVCSFALAWHLAKRGVLVGPNVVPRGDETSDLMAGMFGIDRHLKADTKQYDGPEGLKLPWRPDGDVKVADYGSHMLDV
jgi:hypothetical protein